MLTNCRALLEEIEEFSTKHSVLEESKSDGKRTKIRRLWKRATTDLSDINVFRQKIIPNVLLLNKLEQQHIQGDIKRLLQHQSKNSKQKTLNLQPIQEASSEFLTCAILGHSDIANWISSVDFDGKQRDLLSQRVHDVSSTWILTSEKYVTWIKGKSRTPFCWGMPGGGKTMTTAVVVDHIHSLYRDDGDVVAAYIYCRYRAQHQSAEELFGSILRSLVRQCPEIPKKVLDLFDFEKRRSKGQALQKHEVMKAIALILVNATKRYIIVDALDELEHDDRVLLVRGLVGLQNGTQVNLLLTSRQHPGTRMGSLGQDRGSHSTTTDPSADVVAGISSLSVSRPWSLEDSFLDLVVEIQATDRDVERYPRAEQNLLLLPSCVRKRPELQENVISSIVSVVNGM